MNTIVMICRSKDERPDSFVRLVQTLFPECRIQTVYSNLSPGIPKSLKMGGVATAICTTARKAGRPAPSPPGEKERYAGAETSFPPPLVRSLGGR
jgi:hypothetical protein